MGFPTQIVIFGASGHLSFTKLLPALTEIADQGRAKDGFHVIGVARRPKTDESFRAEIRDGLPSAQRTAFDRLAPRVCYVVGDASRLEELEGLRAKLDSLPGGSSAGRLYYLSLMPSLFGSAVANLSRAGLLERQYGRVAAFRRVVIEKPFGWDLASARELNAALHGSLDESQIYRIDHYLGKETVQNVLGLRFHNAIFEPIWNRDHVELIQITVAEEAGVGSRGTYYDGAGAFRDMLQNHILQILALVCMEAPSSLEADEIRALKTSLLKSLRLPQPARTVRGRYREGSLDGRTVPGYLDELGVAQDSTTETFVAVRAELDNWRWGGVPVLLRHGKRMGATFSEVQIQFRTPPLQLFNRPEEMPEMEYRRALREGRLCQSRPNILTLSIQPQECISLSFGVKRPGNRMIMAPARLSFDYREQFGQKTIPAYERLLLDALLGDPTLFLHASEIEASWAFANQVLDLWQGPDAPPLLDYEAGSWGPIETDELFVGCEGGWSVGCP